MANQDPRTKPCIWCGTLSTFSFCSDACEHLAEWERPGSTDRFNARDTFIDSLAFVATLSLLIAVLRFA